VDQFANVIFARLDCWREQNFPSTKGKMNIQRLADLERAHYSTGLIAGGDRAFGFCWVFDRKKEAARAV